jgi:UDP-N-acetylglucosamine acyltransferase
MCQIGEFRSSSVAARASTNLSESATTLSSAACRPSMHDVIPYRHGSRDNRAHLAGLNIVGLRRRGFTREEIHDLRRAYRLLFANEGTLKERVGDVAEEFAAYPLVHEVLDFIRGGADRAICTPRESSGSSAA